jgi:transposase
VRLGEPAALPLTPAPVQASFDYLELAVALHVWEEWELTSLLDAVLPRGQDEVSAGAVVGGLVLHRCVAPASKLGAVRWYPKTALPELLGITPEQFNNSRVHRVLEAVDKAGDTLQRRLPALHHDRRGAAAALFLDVTDAWFEGRGCELAQRARTKEGLRNRRKIGVVLLCDSKGFPLRWEVVPGKRADAHSLGDMVEALRTCPWVGEAPVVCDRAMGTASGIAQLLRSGLRFLTAVPRNEFESHTDQIPHAAFADLEPEAEHDPSDVDVKDLKAAQQAFARDVARAGEAAQQAGLEQVEETLYVLDLKLGTRPIAEEERRWVGP